MTTERDESELRKSLDSYRTPPPFPARSLWEGLEERRTATLGPGAGRRAVRLPTAWAAAAALALFAGGAAVGSLLSGSLATLDGRGTGGDDEPAVVPGSRVEPMSPGAPQVVVWL